MKKGFTLIEMIGVMVILSLLMLFAVPNVINYIKKGGDTKDRVVKTMIYEASRQYINDNQKMFKKDKKNTYCISVNTLANEGYVESPIKLSSSDEDITSDTSTKTVKVTYDKDYKYELVNECNGIVNPTPILYKGLTPVMYDEENGNWVVADPQKNDWYNYDEQRWANAVVLGEGKTKNPGDIVTVEETLDENENPVPAEALMMLVWIPRYEYKIEGQYGKHPDGTDGTQETPGEIKVNFIGKNKTTPTEGYHINNAFNFDGEKNGFWVGKFELSHKTLSASTTDNNLGCSTTSCTNASGLRILPNVSTLRYNNVSNFWYGIKSIENTSSFGLSNIDTHMMKNSEWGAVAYLSQSKYGKYGNSEYEGTQKEIYINNSSKHYTGRSGGNPGGNTPINETYTDQTDTTLYTNYGYYTYDGYLLSYNTNNKTETRDINKGAGASTTGNIYGVYDMSGGSREYVMGVYGDSQGIYSGDSAKINSGFNGRTGNDNGNVTSGVQVPDSKYYDIYANSTNSDTDDGSLSCNNGICYGHGISEIKGSTTNTGWYGDYTYKVTSSSPWFVRGGRFSSDTSAGVFGRYYYDGNSSSDGSARVVGFGK